jgi:hypothetical protein
MIRIPGLPTTTMALYGLVATKWRPVTWNGTYGYVIECVSISCLNLAVGIDYRLM